MNTIAASSSMQQARTAHSQIGHHPFMQPPRMQQAATPTGSAQQTHKHSLSLALSQV
jgi:hypothetical protein